MDKGKSRKISKGCSNTIKNLESLVNKTLLKYNLFMFKRVKFTSHFTLFRVVLSVLFLLTATELFAQETSESSGNQWYICEIKSKKKANENKYFGPFESKETALANWIYRNLEENKKYCIALKLTYMTSTPSSYFGREYKAVKEDYDFDRDYFIKKYKITTDEKVEAAYLKSQGKKAPKAEKASKSKKNASTEVTESTENTTPVEATETKGKAKKEKAVKEPKEKKEKAPKEEKPKKEKAVKEPKNTVPEVDMSALSDSEKAKQNALIAAELAKAAAADASEKAKLETEKAKENKKATVENNKDDALKNAEELQLQSKETLNSSKEAYVEIKDKAKSDSEEAKQLAEENGDSDLYTLPETLDKFYKKEKRDALAKQIKKEAEESKKAEEAKAAAEEKKSDSISEGYENVDASGPQSSVILIDDNAGGKQPEIKLPEPEPVEEDTSTFKFTSTSKNVSRYKKEYLQDFMPQEKYVPQAENTLKQRIENPDETDAKGQTLLMKAAKSGNDWQIRTLLDSGANVNLKDNDGWTALMYACRYQESISTLKTLIEAGAKIKEKNNYDSSALILAASYNDNPEILSYLLKYYSNSEKEVLKCFILLLSSKQSSEYLQIAKVNLFMQKSIPLNTFYQGKTPLMYAAQYGNSTKTLKLLLDNDALTTIRSSEGKTAFDYAAKNSNLVHDENYWALNNK